MDPSSTNHCKCICDPDFCLSRRPTNGQGATPDVSCQFDCGCKKECALTESYKNATDPSFDLSNFATYDDSDVNHCQGACTNCTGDPSQCTSDEDCVDQGQADGFSVCVESGLCTNAKDDLCDSAYEAVSGSGNNRAKCCPDTSGCIKTRIGVVHTSTCGNVCGLSCLGDEKNPGNYGYSPSTFCAFGSRLENMPYCPNVANNVTVWYQSNNGNNPFAGEFSCTGNNDAEGDNSICCWQNSTQAWRNEADATARDNLDVSINGKFNCDPTGESTVGYGQVVMDNQYALGWTVDGHEGKGGVTSNPNEPICIDSTGSYSTDAQRNLDSIDACPP